MLLYIFLLVVNAWSIPAAPLFTTNNKCLASSKSIIASECENLNLSMSIKVPTEENTKLIRCSLLNETFNNLCNATDDTTMNTLISDQHFEIGVQAEEVCPHISNYLNKTDLSQYFKNLDTCKKICVDFNGKFYDICRYIALFSYHIVHPDNSASHAAAQIETFEQPDALIIKTKKLEETEQEIIPQVSASAVKVTDPEKDKITAITQAALIVTKPEVEAKITLAAAEKLPVNEKLGNEKQTIVDTKHSTTEGAAPNASEEVNKPMPTYVEAVSTTTVVQSFTTLKAQEKTIPTAVSPEKQSNKQFEENMEDSNAENDIDVMDYPDQEKQQEEKMETNLKPSKTKESMFPFPNDVIVNEDDSYFFFYFMVICVAVVLGYVGYHNKQKILAIVLEGRKGRRNQRRRPNSANYHKLDCNLEEAVTSTCSNKSTTNVIY